MKGEASSQTVCIESIFITAAVDEYKGRDIATVDLPSIYLHTENDKSVDMEPKGQLAELMGRVALALY